MVDDDRQQSGAATERLVSTRRLIGQLIGFLIGAALLAWCVRIAVKGGDWSRLTDADWRLVALIIGCTIVSLMANGATFWLLIRPIKPMSMLDLQWLNVACNLLNYAPIRAGAITRTAYHLRVDRMPLLQIGAWFASIIVIFVLVLGACVVATLVSPRIDVVWALLAIGQIVVGVWLVRTFVAHRFVARFGQGADRMLGQTPILAGVVGLRIVDLAAFVGRMGAAAAILGLDLEPDRLVILAIVAAAARLVPFGRVGFAEAAVAAVAVRLNLDQASLAQMLEQTGPWAQLALIESAGEAIVFIPGGAITLFWLRRRWRQAAADGG